jgi:hypothetical protein
MKINTARVRKCLRDFDFKALFVEELGWNRYPNKPIELEIDSHIFVLHHIAESAGMVAFLCEDPETGKIPQKTNRLKIENKIKGIVHEHIIIFTDKSKTESLWLWVKRESKKAAVPREHKYHRDQPGDSLLQKLSGIAFSLDDLDDQGGIDIATVKQHVAKVFDVDRVTKKFYNEFKSEHAAFLKFIKGIDSLDDSQWYASVMLNRLMFIYFIQKKGFLNSDLHYLSNKFKSVREKKKDTFYREFLVRLFFEGFALEPKERTPETKSLLGTIPFLNGGLFMPHQIEEKYSEKIHIADSAFDKLFQFFERYTWHLDDRPLCSDNEINPDVLGYIFEKYINQKQMGAYYTKEDITDYICKNTIIPFLFDRHANLRYGDMNPFPMKDVEPYIYEAVKLGVELPLPEKIAVGVKDVSKRTDWNRPADPDYALPTEIWRETVARRQRCQQIKDDFAAGKITNINDLITYNLDIRKFAYDWARGISDSVTLRAFYFENLTKITVLDPTCGSGAFLFAALNILEPLYEICLDKMAKLSGPKYPDFKAELERVTRHPNRKYFIYKSIIINNLFGVDLMEEAVEICKLRLFLKLVAQVDDVNRIEPLPDIDFNIKSGNTLVGYASLAEIEKAKAGQFDFGDVVEKVKAADRELSSFRKLQTELDVRSAEFRKAKDAIKAKLKEIRDELDKDLATGYGISTSHKNAYEKWRVSHQPFHWFVEFYDIMSSGGFDVVIGNPPYVEYSKVRSIYSLMPEYDKFSTNLYASCCFRANNIKNPNGYSSFIVPVSFPSTDRMQPLRDLLRSNHSVFHVSFSTRPSKLFEEAEQRLTIFIQIPSLKPRLFSGGYVKWSSNERPSLFSLVEFVEIEPLIKRKNIWPKVKGITERAVFSKVSGFRTLGELGVLSGGEVLYYKNTGIRYFNTVTLRAPKCWINGKPASSSRETHLPVGRDTKPVIHTLLLSSTFFCSFQVTSNCRDLNPSDIHLFSVPETLFSESELKKLSAIIEKDYVDKGKIIKMQNKLTGIVELESLSPAKSKPLIDEIDRVLAKHYGFTDEELDFIINYDIKYRMGKGIDSDDE